MENDVIDLNGQPERLDKVFWIGQGKCYPKNPPADLTAYRDSVYCIPKDWLAKLLPNEDLSISAFIVEHLPSRRSALINAKAKGCYQLDIPSENPQCLQSRNIPTKEFIDEAKATFNQSLLDGARSFKDPSYKGRPLPLWTINLWDEMTKVLDAQVTWQNVDFWLNNNTDNSARRVAIDECRGYLKTVGWNSTINIAAGKVKVLTVASMLADSMISGHVLDLMIASLKLKLESNETCREDYYIVPLTFMDMITKEWKDRNMKPSIQNKVLNNIESHMKDHRRRSLIFPAHLENEQHFIGFKIDFKTKEISYGDSLHHELGDLPSIEKIATMLQWWLKKQWKLTFSFVGCVLAHGRQQDGTSCGFTTVNMLAHESLGEPLWNVSQRTSYRIQWFNILMKERKQEEHEWPINSIDENVDISGSTSPGKVHSPTEMPHTPAMSSSKMIFSDFEPAAMEDNEDIYGEYKLAKNTPEFDMWVDEISALSVPSLPPSSPTSSLPTTRCSSLARDDEIASNQDGDDDGAGMTIDAVHASPVEAEKKKEIHPFFSMVKERFAKKRAKGDSEDVGDVEENREQKRRRQSKVVSRDTKQSHLGLSKSVTEAHRINAEIDAGTFIPNEKRLSEFKRKIRELDPRAEFDSTDCRLVRHSKCGEFKKMRTAYDTKNFITHLDTTNCAAKSKKSTKLSGAGMPTLDSMKAKWLAKPTVVRSRTDTQVHCPGLTAAYDQRISVYLERTNATGGGAPHRDAVLSTLFPKTPFDKLSESQKTDVRVSQRLQRTWRNEHDLQRVYSTSCSGSGTTTWGDPSQTPQPCFHCRELLKNRTFQRLVSMPLPKPENLKFTPKQFREMEDETEMIQKYGTEGLRKIVRAYKDDPRNPCLLYARGVIEGRFKDESIFVDLVEAMVTRVDKKARGVGFQGFRYAPGVVEFGHILSIHSKRGYEVVRKAIQMPVERTHQINRARQPRFPVDITDEVFENVVGHLKALNYEGPLCLSCDDTQLLPSLQPYYDLKTDKHYLLGSNSETPMILADHKAVAESIRQAKIEKATKLRLWCIQVPMPGIPGIIAAAKAIPNSLKAETLVSYTYKLLDGFLRKGLCIVACAADGSTVERSVQSMLTSKAKKKRTFRFKHPKGGDITLEIPLFGVNDDQPVVMIQDSQHACKTARNAAFSGARTLILGNHPVLFKDLRRLATEDGPLYNRDVEKLDRQDDSAAIRLFSGDALKWFTLRYPELLGPIIYLFVFGELIDAYQNRHINHLERIRMAFRAQFFIENWEIFLVAAGYPKGKYFISKEACDIMKTLIQGLLKLVLVYRDLPVIYPLLLWLLSTEVCEHVFGLCRQIRPDFTILDFYYMVPKLFVRLREAAFFKTTSNGKERASGYNHLYHDVRGIDLNALSVYPTDREIQDTIQSAYEESENLWHLLGFTPGDLNDEQLPSISAWFSSDPSTPTHSLSDDLADSDYEDNLDGSNAEEEITSETREVNEAIDLLENVKFSSFDEEDKVNNLTYAAVSVAVNESIEIHMLDEYDAKTSQTKLQEEAMRLQDTLDGCIPAVVLPEEPMKAYDHPPNEGLNLQNIVELRFNHQRQQAKTGIRRWPVPIQTALDEQDTQSSPASEPTPSSRTEILKELNAVIKSVEEKGVQTGLGRGMRWGPGRNPTGNSFNAEEVAKKQTNALLTKRKAVFAKLRFDPEYGTARITVNTPLVAHRDGDSSGNGFGFIFHKGSVVLAKVLSVYSKSGAKTGKHGRVNGVHNITAASNIVVQIFEHSHRRTFTDIPQSHRHLQLKRFDLISHPAFLINLDKAPMVPHSGRGIGFLEVSEKDSQRFTFLKQYSQKIVQIQKLLVSRVPKAGHASDNEEAI